MKFFNVSSDVCSYCMYVFWILKSVIVPCWEPLIISKDMLEYKFLWRKGEWL